MANTQYALFSISLLDELGIKSSMTIPAMIDPTTGTPAALKTAWDDLSEAVDGVIGSQITGGSVAIITTPGGTLKTSPAAGSRVEQTGLFNFSNATSKYKFGIDVPSIKNTVLSGNKVDLTNGAVSTLLDLLTAAFTGGVFANTSQYPLVALVDALLSFRKRRKQLARASFEPGA